MLTLDCPRCGAKLHPVRLGFSEGAYRDASWSRPSESGWQCARCEVGVVPGEMVDSLMKRVPVGGGPSERERRRTSLACPSCFGALDHVLLSWGESYVEIEQCPRCRTMLLDPGELPRVFTIEQDAQQD